jgi:hypothetical protein
LPSAKVTVAVRPENCRQDIAEACTVFGPPPTIYFPDVEYLFSGGQGTDAERESVYLNFLHELGHVYDFTQTVHAYRRPFLRILRLPLEESSRGAAADLTHRVRPSSWMHAGSAQPDELFAMAYSYCAAGLDFSELRATIHGVYWGYGYDPTRRQYEAICSLLRGQDARRRAKPTRPSHAPTRPQPRAGALQPPPGSPLLPPPSVKLPQPPPLDRRRPPACTAPGRSASGAAPARRPPAAARETARSRRAGGPARSRACAGASRSGAMCPGGSRPTRADA